jgi:3-oxoacid CoA-transferase A subunit
MTLDRLDPQSIARRAAAEITPGSVVAVSGDWAVAAADLVPEEKGVWFLRAGGTLSDLPINAADAGAILRGGHVDLAILTASQVDSNGSFAGYHAADYPGPQGHAGLIDLAGARRVIVVLPHTADDGSANIVDALSYPPDGVRCAGTIITDAAVFRVSNAGLTLTEVAPRCRAEDVRAITGAAITTAPPPGEMDFTLPPGKPPSKVYADGPSAIADLPDGATVFIDGFGGPGGMAHYVLVSLRDRGSRRLTIVSNTAGIARVVSFGTPPGHTAIDHSVLVENGQVAKAIASFPVSPSVSRPSAFELAYRRGECDLELVPQGTLAERLRAGGAGIEGFYTPTGAGTLIAEGKESRLINGREHILEHGLRADFALIRAHQADTRGNLVYRGTSRNFNAVMAPAARVTVVEVDEIVQPGQLDPDAVVTPGIFVQRIVRRPDGFTGYE